MEKEPFQVEHFHCFHYEVCNCDQILVIFSQFVYLIDSFNPIGFEKNCNKQYWKSSKMDCFGSKTRSLSQILEKPCVCSRGHIFRLIIMKLGQNICLDETSE